MSLLLCDGEIIEIPEYILRIVHRAQEIVSGENENQISPFNLENSDVLSTWSKDDSELTVKGPDGCTRTVSEYILEIIRTAQKIVQDDPRLEDDIRDYDEFIDSTFDSMLNDIDSDTPEDSSVIAQTVVERLIEEVCSMKITMPELDNSLVSTIQEEVPDSTKKQQNSIPELIGELNDHIVTLSNSETMEVYDEASNVSIEVVKSDDVDGRGINEETFECMNNYKTESIPKTDEIMDNKNKEMDELKKVADKFVQDICENVRNELSIEEENKTNESAVSKADTEKGQKDSSEEIDLSQEINDLKDTANGQVDKKPDEEFVENKTQNHTAKVHPEETQPAVTNLEDITQSDGQATEGKSVKEQKNDVSKDKIKSKRRARGLRNSFRRMFSCFSTKSSQLE